VRLAPTLAMLALLAASALAVRAEWAHRASADARRAHLHLLSHRFGSGVRTRLAAWLAAEGLEEGLSVQVAATDLWGGAAHVVLAAPGLDPATFRVDRGGAVRALDPAAEALVARVLAWSTAPWESETAPVSEQGLRE
jgi:hypothetical protein